MVVVDDELGMELIRLTFEEAVETVEPSGERPLVERPGRGDVVGGSEMPLTGAERDVPLRSEHLGERRRVVRHVPQLVRKPGLVVRDRPHAHRVLRPPGEERGAGRRAERRHVEVGEPEPLSREPIDVGRVDVRPVATELREPGVVEENDDHVGRSLGRMRSRRKVGLGVVECAADPAVEACRAWCGHRSPQISMVVRSSPMMTSPSNDRWANSIHSGYCSGVGAGTMWVSTSRFTPTRAAVSAASCTPEW